MKEELVTHLKKLLEAKLLASQNNFKEIQESLLNDSKSSAGDKHETARAMAQIELEQAGKQLNEVEKLIQNFKLINFEETKHIKLGSLIETENCYFFLSLALGKIEITSKPIYCIGIQAPLTQTILGKKVKESISFNNQTSVILSIS